MKVVALGMCAVVLSALSAWFVFAAFSVQITVVGAAAPQGYDGIANLQAMHIQMADIVIGMGSGIAAAFLFGAAVVVAAIESGRAFNG